MTPQDSHPRHLFEADAIGRMIEQLTDAIVDLVGQPERLALVGIRTHGVTLARRIREKLQALGWDVPMGIVDITLYRDDLGQRATQPIVRPTEIDFDIDGRIVVLVDDVIATGRTIRCALDEILSYGRPDAIRLTVLVDRGSREFPIQPDIVGEVVDAQATERVEVRLDEEGQADAVWVAANGSSAND